MKFQTDEELLDWLVENRKNDPATVRKEMAAKEVTPDDVKRVKPLVFENPEKYGTPGISPDMVTDFGDPQLMQVYDDIGMAGLDIDPNNMEEVGGFLSTRNVKSAQDTEQALADIWGGAENIPSDPNYRVQVSQALDTNQQRMGPDSFSARDYLEGIGFVGSMVGLGALAGLGGATGVLSGTPGLGGAVAGAETGVTGGLSNLGIDTSLGAGTNLGEIGAGGAAGGFNTVTGSGLGLNAAAPSGLGLNASIPATAAFTGGALSGLPNIAATGAGGLTDITAGSAAVNAAGGLTPAGEGFAPAATTVPNIANTIPTETGGITPSGTTPGTTGTAPGTTSGVPGLPTDLGSLAGLAAAGLGAYGASEQADNQMEMFNKYWGAGEPYRTRLEASYQPGFSMANEPGYTDWLDTTGSSILRGLSIKGNPAENPGLTQTAVNNLGTNYAFPALTQYRGQLGNFGGLSQLNTAAANTGMPAATAQTNWMQPLGAGLANYFNPPKQLSGWDPVTGKFTYSA